MKALRSFETSDATHPKTQCHILEGLIAPALKGLFLSCILAAAVVWTSRERWVFFQQLFWKNVKFAETIACF